MDVRNHYNREDGAEELEECLKAWALVSNRPAFESWFCQLVSGDKIFDYLLN